jgi:DNA (cytosine-5)-methyltransferase 1
MVYVNKWSSFVRKTRSRIGKRAGLAAGLFDELIVDNFAGGGGASMGIERAFGRAVDVAVNHDRQAVAMHQANHPHTLHYCEDVWKVDPLEATGGRPVGLLWASPDCAHFSRAKGCKPVKKKIRGLANVVIKWAEKAQPRVIVLENVREFETWGPLVELVRNGIVVCGADGLPKMVPCPLRKGETFRRWVRKLKRLGYAVQWKTLNAADYGAPTHRKRLFLIARRDGVPIAWPKPTHGPGREFPYRTAAECIDWSLPCHSIFLGRKEGRVVGVNRPLAEKTMRRIALGLKRYVLDNPRPFIVRCEHGGAHFRGQPVEQPLATVTGSHGYGLVAPHVMRFFGEVVGCDPGEPLPTITAVDHHGVMAAHLIQHNDEKGSEVRGKGLGDPINTVVTENRFALVSAFLSRHYGDRPEGSASAGHPVDGPSPTITGRATQNMLAAAHLIKMNFGDKQWSGVDEPAGTILAGANHHGLVVAFLTKYFGKGNSQDLLGPLHTLTTKHRFGLVTVKGEDYAVVDIGLRMLRPRELFLCQGFPENYVLDPEVDGKRLSATAQVKMVGNSVCPQVAEAVVRANFPGECAKPAKSPKRRAAIGVA